MQCDHLTVTPQAGTPLKASVQESLQRPELQATYVLSRVWTYTGQSMNLHWFSSRGAEDMAGQNPTNTRTQSLVTGDLGGGVVEGTV